MCFGFACPLVCTPQPQPLAGRAPGPGARGGRALTGENRFLADVMAVAWAVVSGCTGRGCRGTSARPLQGCLCLTDKQTAGSLEGVSGLTFPTWTDRRGCSRTRRSFGISRIDLPYMVSPCSCM